MAYYTFRIHKSTAESERDGWQQSVELKKEDENTGINSIEDLIDGGNAGKIGTSIPTPFARIYLFKTAFDYVTSNQGRDRSKYNFYDQLVSQSLDLLQLIFERGKDEKLKIYEWNGEAQLRALMNSTIREGHKVLGEALHMAIVRNEKLRSIRLIEYDGVILGGTSPMTLTYTSPNATQLLSTPIFTNNKEQLFVERNVKHLNERSKDFQKYIYWLVQNDAFERDGSPLASFKEYVKQWNLRFSQDELNNLEACYPELIKPTNGGADIRLSVYGDVVLRYNDTPINMDNSDFIMKPNIECYGNGPIPVVLPTDGDAAYEGWRYIANDAWKSFTTVAYYNIENTRLEERLLPTNGAENQFTTNKYPWLTTDDFFESSIICLGFNLNKERFFFPSVQDHGAQFLLPIKKEYFKYFTLEDLRENLTCEVNLGNNNIPKDISFKLKIRLKNRPNITLNRKYTASANGDFKIVDTDGVSFGVFPFYRCPEAEDKKNEYSIYLYGFSEDTQYANLNFYRQDKSQNALLHVNDDNTGHIRTATPDTGYSKIYNLRNEISNSFDIIEMILKKGSISRGLAIPMWFVPNETNNDRKTIISVDFGTSNTYVSFSEKGSPQPLSIEENEQQMVLLNDKSVKKGTVRRQYRDAGAFGQAQFMSQYLREFVPSVIGNQDCISEDEFIEYPIKTATIEKLNFQPTDKLFLFSGISIGFNIDNEKTKVDSTIFKYVTNLKWNAEEHKRRQDRDGKTEFNKDENRIKAFCDQTLWMVKNKLVMNGYSSKGQMMYFYPDSMSKEGRAIFRKAWQESINDIFTKRGFEIELNEELESISPYYSLQAKYGSKIGGQKSIANIDIGGGTTDYFILDQSNIEYSNSSNGTTSGKAYEASIFFAGDDLWGATYPESTRDGNFQKNGFVYYMKDMVDACANKEEARKLYDSYDQNKRMADFSSFFFKNDKVFRFSDLISGNRKFRFVVFLHYASIIYHLVEILKVIKSKEPEFKYPEILTFTGKGSEYIKMLSEDENVIAQITTDLIKAFGIKDFRTIDIIPIDNPKALTANGGIYKMNSDPALKINLYDEEAYGAKKLQTLTNTPYERIGKICLGLPPKSDGTKYRKSEVIKVSSQALQEFEKFAKAVFYSEELASSKKYFEFDIKDEDYKKVMEFAENSYGIHAKRFFHNNVENAAADEELEESVFFFALKNTLIELSMYYYNTYIKKQQR